MATRDCIRGHERLLTSTLEFEPEEDDLWPPSLHFKRRIGRGYDRKLDSKEFKQREGKAVTWPNRFKLGARKNRRGIRGHSSRKHQKTRALDKLANA